MNAVDQWLSSDVLATPETEAGLRRRERVGGGAVLVAIALYVLVALHLTRGTVQTFDSMTWMTDASSGAGLSDLFSPHNGHLIFVTRALYATSLWIFGDSPLPPQLMLIVAVAATSWLMFRLLLKRVDPLIAGAASIVVLFLGTSSVVLDPTVAVFAQTTAFGFGALLTLEWSTRRGDAVACALLVLGVLAFSAGLAFVVGAAVLIAFGSDRVQRAWVPIVPLVVYGVWFLAAGDLDDGGGSSSLAAANILLIPQFDFDSLASGLAAVTGLGGDLTGPRELGMVAIGWGRVFAVGFLVLLLIRFRERIPPRAAALIAIAMTYWTMQALAADEFRTPQLDRYVFVSAAVCILLAAELPPSRRLAHGAVLAAVAVATFSFVSNLSALRSQGVTLRVQSQIAKADLGTVEIAGDAVRAEVPVSAGLLEPVSSGTYLAMTDEHGDLGYSAAELSAAGPGVRTEADENLVRILGIAPVSAPRGGARSGQTGECSEVDSMYGVVVSELPAGGAVIKGAAGADLHLRRFGDTYLAPMQLPEAGAALITIPDDSSTQPWSTQIETGGSVRICALNPTGS